MKKTLIAVLIFGSLLALAVAGLMWYRNRDTRPVLTVTKAEMEEAISLDGDKAKTRERLTRRKILEKEAPKLGVNIPEIRSASFYPGQYDQALTQAVAGKLVGETTFKTVFINFSTAAGKRTAEQLAQKYASGSANINLANLPADIKIEEFISTEAGIFKPDDNRIFLGEDSVSVMLKIGKTTGLGEDFPNWLKKTGQKYQIIFL